MKKGMMVMAIVVALSFLVSMIAVSPAVAKQVTQTQPTSKQQTQQPAQTPASQGINKPADFKPTAYEKAKEKFWGLQADHCDANGVLWSTNSDKLTLKVGQPVTITCYYKVKTVPVYEITEADAKYWGTGKSYTIGSYVLNTKNNTTVKKEEIRTLPKFTWKDAQKWQISPGGESHVPKIWNEHMVFTWTPTQEYLGDNVNIFHFCVDCANVIEEYDGGPNDHIYGAITVNP